MGWGGSISELNGISLLFIRFLTLWEENFNYDGLTKPKYSSMILFSWFLTTVSLQHAEFCLKFVPYVKWWGKGSSELNHLALLFKMFSLTVCISFYTVGSLLMSESCSSFWTCLYATDDEAKQCKSFSFVMNTYHVEKYFETVRMGCSWWSKFHPLTQHSLIIAAWNLLLWLKRLLLWLLPDDSSVSSFLLRLLAGVLLYRKALSCPHFYLLVDMYHCGLMESYFILPNT